MSGGYVSDPVCSALACSALTWFGLVGCAFPLFSFRGPLRFPLTLQVCDVIPLSSGVIHRFVIRSFVRIHSIPVQSSPVHDIVQHFIPYSQSRALGTGSDRGLSHPQS